MMEEDKKTIFMDDGSWDSHLRCILHLNPGMGSHERHKIPGILIESFRASAQASGSVETRN